ncbi:MAG: transglycosylase domain-containing protein [Gaiellaceae bacterium]
MLKALRRTEPPRKRRRIRKLRLVALLLILLVLMTVAFTLGLVRAVAGEIPALDPSQQRGDVNSVIYASNGVSQLAVLSGSESRVLVPRIDEIAPIMRQAIVSVEDQRFYENKGVDLRGVLRAIVQDVRSGKVVEGGSTITQQFVKNAYIRNQRTLGRKIREAALAWQLTQRWSKDRILLAYLNTIYFGNGAYGIQQAAQAYFGIRARRLDLAQSALLAGIPADPSAYDPVTRPAEARARRHGVLLLMVKQQKITVGQLQHADKELLPRAEDVRLPGKGGLAPYFVNYVKDQLVARYGTRRVFGGGLHVTTTIDLGLQDIARAAIKKILPNPDGPAAALVAIDPRDGSVKAMFGGTNFRTSQFNLATQAERQPGSSFKPFVLATALHEGLSPLTSFDSKPVTIFTGDRYWHVTNYESDYVGRSNLADGMVHSDNAVYAQLTQLAEPKRIVTMAHALGIRSRLDPFFSIGLGALAVNPLDMARAYATIANDGRRVDSSIFGDRPRVVVQVKDVRSGHTKINAPLGHPALTRAEAETLTSILQRVVTSGTGVRASLADRPVAGKTGTTDNYGDAWFVGYTPQLVVAVWVGYPNELKPMLTEFGGKPVAGGTLPAEIWKEFMTRALPALGDKPETFSSPPYLGYSERRVAYRKGAWRLDNGYCKQTQAVVFFSGRGPAGGTADCKPNEVAVPSVVGRFAASATARLASQPLGVQLVYAPAKPATRPGVVIRQYPPNGGLSANDTVILVVTKARYGLVPDLVGSSLAAARVQIRKLRLKATIVYRKGAVGTILRQSLLPGVAAGPRLPIRLVVGG